ncbi:TrlF family AAA-like ATPase [Micromonospora sp. NPDC126480]|uniref:TrlF family AAA-like ATPase n=1 Tax=Micromonospora sp. NPDC126480 TaxID=3155312 RepID=UPI003329261B
MTNGGSRWRRVDFHLHTPGVDSFAGFDGMSYDGPDDQRKLATAYADRLSNAGIEIAAITDYNGIRLPWYDLIKEEAAKQGIIVLPGAELNLAEGRQGVHILVVFPQYTPPAAINDYLKSLDRDPSTPLWKGRTHREIELQKPPAEALRQLRERFGCLIIPAHGDAKKGIVAAMGANLAARLIAETDVDGLDHAGGALPKLRSTGISHRWDHLAQVEFSDPRSIDDIGGKPLADGTVRGTWLKLSSTSLEAMRLALHDPETRVRTVAPVLPYNPRIISITIEGSGFLAGTQLVFDAHLNTLIGGRGTGKSALLETIRYGLALEPFCEQKRRDELVKHALGSGGRVTLEIERHSDSGPTRRYIVKRVLGESPRVFDPDRGQVDIAPRDAFGPDREPIILLQREIDQVSGEVDYRRQLLDRLIGDEVKAAEREVDDVRRRLRTNGAELRKHVLEQAKRPELESQIAKLTHELDLFQQTGAMDKLATHDRLQTIERSLTSACDFTSQTSGIGNPWRQALQDLQETIDNKRGDLTGRADDLTGVAEQALSKVTTAITTAEQQIIAALIEANETIEGLRAEHAARVLPLADELNHIKQELHAERLDPERPLKLSSDRTVLRDQLATLERKVPAGTALRNARLGLLDELTKARARESQVRADAAARINSQLSGRVEVAIVAHGDRHRFTEDLRQLLQGSGASGAAIEAIAMTDGADGSIIASAVTEGPAKLTQQFDVTVAQANKIWTWLTDENADRISELEILAPRDRVDIRLHVDGEAKTLDRLSAGQRATAILLLIFAIDGRCMILDQPEDDLDNRFSFDDVVQMIRSQKAISPSGGNRQIIAATHNPNIPVLGDAELVVVLDAGNDQVRVLAQGSIDAEDIRTHIRQVLEGGEEAFLRRYTKYGGARLSLPSSGIALAAIAKQPVALAS